MKFESSYIFDKNTWEKNISKFEEANFLQSWNWGEFHESMGRVVERLVVKEGGRVVAMVQMVKEEAKRGSYFSIAGGPLADWKNQKLIVYLFSEIKKVATQHSVKFIRFRPQEVDSEQMRSAVKKVGAIASNMHLTADLTLQLDITLPTDEILKQMRKNTRSAIRKSEKEGIKVVFSTDKDEIKQFSDHQSSLAQKHGFVPFSYQFLFKQFEAFVKDDQVLLIHSYKNKKLLSSAFVIFYNGEAVYHYGISTPENRKLPGSYACQWAAINEAKKRGCSKYNFWGIAPEDQKDHRFAGVSLFKRGFGGEEINYLPSHDIPLSKLYFLTFFFELFRKKSRNL